MVGELAQVNGGLLRQDGLHEQVADHIRRDHAHVPLEVFRTEFFQHREAEITGRRRRAFRTGSGRRRS